MQRAFKIIATALAALVIGYHAVGFQTPEGGAAIVTRLGKPRRVAVEPGFYLKLPWPIERVALIDARPRFFDTSYAEMLTLQQMNLAVYSFVIWRVGDPLAFQESFSAPEEADQRLDGLVVNAAGGIIGNYEFNHLVSSDPGELRLAEVERKVFEAVVRESRANFGEGIIIEQVGFKRISLPQANIDRVYEFMREERSTVATAYIAEGNRRYSDILSEAESHSRAIYAAAYRRADEIAGTAQAQAAEILAGAHAQNPEFYLFSKTMDSLESMLYPNTTLLLSIETPPFDIITAGPGRSLAEIPAEPADLIRLAPSAPETEADHD